MATAHENPSQVSQGQIGQVLPVLSRAAINNQTTCDLGRYLFTLLHKHTGPRQAGWQRGHSSRLSNYLLVGKFCLYRLTCLPCVQKLRDVGSKRGDRFN